MGKTTCYPPNPDNVPEDLTLPSAENRRQTLLLLVALMLFFLLYFGLMLIAVLCVAAALWFLVAHDGPARLWGAVFVSPAALLFVYMLKNLVKSERAAKDFQIEIFEDEHPNLFAFIRQLCDDVGVDPPLHVYVDYHVNAKAIADRSSFFHLLLPTGRSLCIGLGLVNAINLTEFKALLAHEFGHFSQRGMKLRIYVGTAVRIAKQIVRGQDALAIDAWARSHPVLAWPAYVMLGLRWALRKIMEQMAYAVFFVHQSLSRQEEFHADAVAVSLTGSDALAYLLYRCNIGESSFHQAVTDLKSAMSEHLFTSDLFYHQSASVKLVHLEEPLASPDDPEAPNQLFADADDQRAEMWESHPSNYDRERNAKAHYIRSVIDPRSPWLLFDNVEELRERVTAKFYRFYFNIPKGVILAEPTEVQHFIDEGHAERTYDPKYQGLYDCRNLMLDDISELARGEPSRVSGRVLEATHATLYDAAVKHRAQLYNKRVKEKKLLVAICNRWHKPRNDEFEFRNEFYAIDHAERLLKQVDAELDTDHAWIKAHDLRVFMTYFQMALHIDQEVAEELNLRYAFHVELQRIREGLTCQEKPMQSALEFMNGVPGPMQPHHFRELVGTFRDAHKAMNRTLNIAKGMTLPGLKNMPAGQPLRPFLLEDGLLEGFDHADAQRWIMKLLDQFREMKAKVDRIHYKSLAGILGLQEQVGAEFLPSPPEYRGRGEKYTGGINN